MDCENKIDLTGPAKTMSPQRGDGGETHLRADADSPELTTQQGVVIVRSIKMVRALLCAFMGNQSWVYSRPRGMKQ